MEKALNNSGPARQAWPQGKRAEPGRQGAKDALEWLMHTIFYCAALWQWALCWSSVCTLVFWCAAMKEIGLTDFLLGRTWAPASDPS